MVTSSQLRQIIPAAGAHADVYAGLLSSAMERFGIDSPARVAAFIATVAYESQSLSRTVENLDYSADGLRKTWPKRFNPAMAALCARNPEKIANIVYASRMGNGSVASGDGWRYRGRGLIQITGRSNYVAAGAGMGLLIADHPELLELPLNAAMSAAWFWDAHDLNAPADDDDFLKIVHRVNGGTDGLALRLTFWDDAKGVFGIAP